MMTSVFDASVRIYRSTFKRIRSFHSLFHHIMRLFIFPFLETITSFKTMPDDPFWFRLELLTRRHEPETLTQIKSILKPGMIVLDIGAHVGYYACRCAELVGETGQVIAFEPHPRTFAILSQNAARFPNIIPIQAAVSDRVGTAQLYDYLMMSASGSLNYDESLLNLQKSNMGSGDVAPRIREDFPVNTFEVETVQIDSLLAKQGIKMIDFIKMDIEGAEMNALVGMKDTIKRSEKLAMVMEFNPKALETFGYEPETTVSMVLDLGFDSVAIIESDRTLTEVTGDSRRIAELTQTLMQKMDVANLFFTRDSLSG